MKVTRQRTLFGKLSRSVSLAAGRPITFFIAAAVIVLWAMAGPLFGFSDTWQLVINTSTTIVTFLMVFLIQSTQNRDTEALQIKLDEIIKSLKEARNEMLDLEELDEAELNKVREEFLQLAEEARARLTANARDV